MFNSVASVCGGMSDVSINESRFRKRFEAFNEIAATALFRQRERFSFVEACIVAYMQAEGLGYLYAFDDDFDAAEDVYRLDIATNPYQPE